MKKVLLIQGVLMHYRVPVLNELAKRVDLTVLYSRGELPDNICFKVLKIPTFQLPRFIVYKKSVYRLAKKFDILIIPLDITVTPFKLLSRLPRKYKVIYWGIGVPASYDTPYDSDNSLNNKFLKFIKHSDACVFYSSYPVDKYEKLGIDRKKLFVANNTVQVLSQHETTIKRDIMFVGSLYVQKKIYDLLDNYKDAFIERNDIPNLVIIGKGDEYARIKEWIAKNGLAEKVILKGEIIDEYEISKYFNSAVICISPGQAGLSVLKSMGYGVPFVTMRDAITGGEIFNIENNVNGIILDSYSEIKDVILETIADKDKYIAMGNNAKEYYKKYRQVNMMANGFEKAIEFVSN